MTNQPSRRAFIKIAAGTGVGLVIGLDLPFASANAVESFAPNPFVRVAPDNPAKAATRSGEAVAERCLRGVGIGPPSMQCNHPSAAVNDQR